MIVHRLFLCIIGVVLYGSVHTQSVEEHNTSLLSIKHIDSLNELAFEVKRNNVHKALSLLTYTKNASEKIQYTKGIALSLLYEGGIFQQNGNSKRALEFYYRSLELSKVNNDSVNIARAEQQIASIKTETGNLAEAEKILNKIIVVYEKMGRKIYVINVLNSIGLIKIDQKQFDIAQVRFEAALKMSIENRYSYGIKKSYYNLGLLYKAKQQYNDAFPYFKKSLNIDNESRDMYGVALSLIEMADVAFLQKQLSSSLGYSTKAFNTADSIEALQLQSRAVDIMIKTFLASSNTEKALEWQQRQITLQKKINEKDKNYAIDFIDILKEHEETTLASQRQVQEIREESKNREILLFIAITLLITGVTLGIPFYRNYKKAKLFSAQLEIKNGIIERNSQSLDQLNKAISKQNHKLEEENKMKDKLLSIISHDLRHPLVNTKSIIDLINLKLVNPKETSELLEQLEAQYVNSLSLLDNLLFWIRGQMKGLKIERTKINMYHLLDTVADELQLPLQKKQIRLVNNIDKFIDWYAEKEILKIIFRNLITNAIKFTPPGGPIELNSNKGKRHSYIIVKDSGIGMTDDVLKKVNLREYYSSKGTSNEKGSGFGLMLVKDLIIKLNGKLIIESEPGKGSSFTIKFPF